MADDLQYVSPGDPLPNRASFFNALIESAKGFRRMKAGGQGARKTTDDPIYPSSKITIQNTTGDDLPEFSILEIGNALVSITDEPFENESRPAYEGFEPSSKSALVCITDGPLADGELGRATLLGHAVCTVNIIATTHMYAAPTAGDTGLLTSATSGPIRIIQAESSGTGEKLATVLLQFPKAFEPYALGDPCVTKSSGYVTDIQQVWVSNADGDTECRRWGDCEADCGESNVVDGGDCCPVWYCVDGEVVSQSPGPAPTGDVVRGPWATEEEAYAGCPVADITFACGATTYTLPGRIWLNFTNKLGSPSSLLPNSVPVSLTGLGVTYLYFGDSGSGTQFAVRINLSCGGSGADLVMTIETRYGTTGSDYATGTNGTFEPSVSPWDATYSSGQVVRRVYVSGSPPNWTTPESVASGHFGFWGPGPVGDWHDLVISA